MSIIHSFDRELIILAWLVQMMSTHGGEERWSRTLKDIYIKLKSITLGNRSNQRKEKEKEQRNERDISLKSHLSQCKHASLSSDLAADA